MGELFATFGLNLSLLITQIINFGILLVGLWWFLYRPAIKMLDDRRAKIKEGVENAEHATVRIQEIEGERDALLSTAANDATGIIQNAKGRAEEQASHIVGDAHTRAEGVLKSAEERAEEMKAQALKESKEEIAQTAILAAAKILKEKKS